MAAISDLLLLAGRGVYPETLARAALDQGVRHLTLIAIKGETARSLCRLAHTVKWVPLGHLARLREVLTATGIRHLVMAGQVSPLALFSPCLDPAARAALRALPVKNAHTIFGWLVREFEALGLEVLPASSFMAAHMPGPGCLTRVAPTPEALTDIRTGFAWGRLFGAADVGQTLVLKQGMVLAVEAFEGTDAAICRGGKLGGPGAVVVKRSKPGHDVRFDLPVIGRRTILSLRRARCAAMAFEAGRTILLERAAVLAEADRAGIALLGMTPPDAEPGP